MRFFNKQVALVSRKVLGVLLLFMLVSWMWDQDDTPAQALSQTSESIDASAHSDAIKEAQVLIQQYEYQINMILADRKKASRETLANTAATEEMMLKAQEELEQNLKKQDELERELQKYNEEIVLLGDKAAKCDKESANYVKVAEDLCQDRAKVEKAIEQTQSKIAGLERKEQELNAGIAKLNTAVTEAKRKASSLETDMRSLEQSLADLRISKAQKLAEIESLNVAIAKAKTPPPPKPKPKGPAVMGGTMAMILLFCLFL